MTETAPNTTDTAPAPNRNNRNNRNRYNRSSGTPRTAPRIPRVSTFKGSTPEMNGHVFECHGEGTEQKQFAKTVEELQHYANKNLKQTNDLSTLFKKLEKPTIPLPRNLDTDEMKNSLLSRIWEKEVDFYVKRKVTLEDNMQALFSIVWGQCSDAMQAKLTGLSTYESIEEECDCAKLLKEIKGITFKFEAQRNPYFALDDAMIKYFTYYQMPGDSNAEHLKTFQSLVEVIEYYGGSVVNEHALLSYELAKKDPTRTVENCTGSEKKEAKAICKTKNLAIAFLKRSDRKRYATLLTELENNYARGTDQLPTTITGAYNLLVNYKPIVQAQVRRQNTANPTQEISFAQNSVLIAGTDGNTYPRTTCFKCQKNGHLATYCPDNIAVVQNAVEVQNAVQLLQDTIEIDQVSDGESIEFTMTQLCAEISLNQANATHINKNWILLDSQSTASVFNNKSFLNNIRPATESNGIRVYGTGGYQDSHLVGDVKNFGTVWYNEHSLANILSMAAVRKKFRITMDTASEAALIVHATNGKLMKFTEYKSGLYYYDPTTTKSTKKSVNSYSFIQTVEENKSHFTRREIEGADKARRLYRLLGRPNWNKFLRALNNNRIRNCPVTAADAKRAMFIYGREVAKIKGITTRQKPDHVPDLVPIPIPPTIKDHHNSITLCADFFFVQGIPFLHTISRKIQFRSVADVTSRAKGTMLTGINAMKRIYETRGFTVTNLHADNEFGCIRNDILPCNLNTTAANEHVGEVERSVRTVKESVRSTCHSIPFKRIPKLMITSMVRLAVTNLNILPAENGISKHLSPHTIITGKPGPDYNMISKVEFGTYVQVHDEPSPTNTNTARTTGAIALNPTGNEQGAYYFMSLNTGERLNRRKWTELPMGNDVIAAVEARALREGQPSLKGGCPLFEWRPDVPIQNNENQDVNNHEPAQLDEEEHDDDDNNDDDIDNDEHNQENTENDDEHEDVSTSDEDNDENIDISFGTENDDDLSYEPEDTSDSDDEIKPNQDESIAVESSDDENTTAAIADIEEIRSDNCIELRSAIKQEVPDIEEIRSDHHIGELRSAIKQEDVTATHDTQGPQLRRSNRERNYEHRNTYEREFQHTNVGTGITEDIDENDATTEPNLTEEEIEGMHNMVTGIVMTQMSAQRGIKKFGQRAVDAVIKEYVQLDDKRVLSPEDATKLTTEQKQKALDAITLLKEKRCGRMKGRVVGNGKKQRGYVSKEDSASPTVAPTSLLVSLVIDAMEARDVATCDIEGAYLHAFMRDYVLLKITGGMVDIMVQVNPEKYEKYVVYENEVKTLSLRILKALY